MNYCKDCIEFDSREGYCNSRRLKCDEYDVACRFFDSEGNSKYSSYTNRCGSCKDFDSNDNWCRSRHFTCKPNDEPCKYYNDSSSSGNSGCWLTTACCEYKGLEDDCKELTILRRFRDEILMNMPDGKEMIQTYYQEAPRIIIQINQCEQKNEIYDWIYEKILNIINKIEEKKYDQAVTDYLYMMYTVDLKSQKTKISN